MNRVALILPNYALRDELEQDLSPPVGIASIAAVLRDKGYEVYVIDAVAENLSHKEAVLRLEAFVPHAVGISCNYSPLHNPTLELAQKIKKSLGNECPVFVGGNHATALDSLLIKSRDIDFIVRGEGEVGVPQLLAVLGGKAKYPDVSGLTYKENSSIIRNPVFASINDLSLLPIPAYTLLPMHTYAIYNIVASRGCPYNCTFCASKVIFQKPRYRSAASIIGEIEYLLNNFGKRHIWFSDDTFTARGNSTLILLDEMEKKRLDMEWSCLTRCNTVDKQILDKMRRLGCKYIAFGVESGSERILKSINKRLKKSEIEDAIKTTISSGIGAHAFFMIGNIGDDENTVKESFKLIKDCRIEGTQFSIALPLPGTGLAEDLIKDGKLNFENVKWDYYFIKIPGLTRPDRFKHYPADLASERCSLSGARIVELCLIGEMLPHIGKLLSLSFFVQSLHRRGLLRTFRDYLSLLRWFLKGGRTMWKALFTYLSL